MNELIELRKYLGLNELHLLGQSWGGMLSIEYLCDHKPEGIKSVILSSTHPSSKLWAQEQHRMIKFMSQEDQDAIAKAEATGNFDDPAYLAANERFMLLHAAGVPKDTDPECLRRPKKLEQTLISPRGDQMNTRQSEISATMSTVTN